MKAIKTKHLWLMAALVCGLGLTVTSCKEDNELSAEEQEQQAEQDMDQAAEFWNVVGQLTDDIMPDEGWQTATYAPAIGMPEGNNDAVRIVSCADDETAAQHFADLVGLTMGDGFDESTMDYTYTNDLIGSLHYHKVLGSSLAIVDVDIAQMPGLSQIIFKTPEQMQENGSFSGTAYYRFGDVVSKQNADGQTDYWICVRPCFGPDGKGDSHWISVSKLPSANVKTVTKRVNGAELTHVMPKSLATKQNHMQNFAELLYAMTNPATWASNLKANYSKLKFFNDMNYKKNYQYNNEYFFAKVADGWDGYGLFKEVLGITKAELRQELRTNGLNLIYNSASMSGNTISLPQASYFGTNLKTRTLSKKTSEWKTEGFNIYNLTKKGYMEFQNLAKNTERAWLVRYATGATLAKGSRENPVFNKYKRLPNCTDVYVYNRDVEPNLNIDNLQAIAPRVTQKPVEEGFDGVSHYRWCDIYKDEEGCRWFVVSMAGMKSSIEEEGSPYTELITFEGIKFNADKSRAINLPTREQAIRGAYWLDVCLFTGTAAKKEYTTLEDFPSRYVYGMSVFHLREHADYDPSSLFQLIWPQSNDERQTTHAASIAYDDHISSNKQPLLRWINNNQNRKQDFYFYIWDSYPSTPSATEQLVTKFSNVPIYLQDINSPDKIAKYAKDTYAIQPLAPGDRIGGTKELEPREPRNADDTDARANDVSNYVYNRSVWWKRDFAPDMWYAPVIMFRITRVLDRGEDNYSTTTVDGHTLKLYKARQWGMDDGGADLLEDNVKPSLQATYEFFDTFYFNGQPTTMPSWKTAW